MTSAEWAASACILFEWSQLRRHSLASRAHTCPRLHIFSRTQRLTRQGKDGSSYPRAGQGYIHRYVSDKLSIEPDTQSGSWLWCAVGSPGSLQVHNYIKWLYVPTINKPVANQNPARTGFGGWLYQFLGKLLLFITTSSAVQDLITLYNIPTYISLNPRYRVLQFGRGSDGREDSLPYGQICSHLKVTLIAMPNVKSIRVYI